MAPVEWQTWASETAGRNGGLVTSENPHLGHLQSRRRGGGHPTQVALGATPRWWPPLEQAESTTYVHNLPAPRYINDLSKLRIVLPVYELPSHILDLGDPSAKTEENDIDAVRLRIELGTCVFVTVGHLSTVGRYSGESEAPFKIKVEVNLKGQWALGNIDSEDGFCSRLFAKGIIAFYYGALIYDRKRSHPTTQRAFEKTPSGVDPTIFTFRRIYKWQSDRSAGDVVFYGCPRPILAHSNCEAEFQER
ncbi:hypothetical protein DFH29DRAFT_1067074 [Suillus ampliporus]|nr:hypothetical protein DFH29DRAFT_1067074 [Suillus ampliporus]